MEDATNRSTVSEAVSNASRNSGLMRLRKGSEEESCRMETLDTFADEGVFAATVGVDDRSRFERSTIHKLLSPSDASGH